jgi:hypothetical protein
VGKQATRISIALGMLAQSNIGMSKLWLWRVMFLAAGFHQHCRLTIMSELLSKLLRLAAYMMS